VPSPTQHQAIYGAGRQEPSRPPRKTKPGPSLPRTIFSLIFSIALITGLIYGFLALWQITSPGETIVPEIKGLDLSAAQLMLQHEGLDSAVVAQRPSENLPAGKIIEAQPESGRKVKRGRRITLVVSTGSAWTNVPDIKEMSEARAEAVLKEKMLYLGKRSYIYSDKLPKGYIVEQLPEPATRLRLNSEVQAVVSQGPRSNDTTTTDTNNDDNPGNATDTPLDTESPQ
jgi:eukaryotic-like serine/threonine-protein kinase